MALIVEDGTCKTDADSYASVATADAYFSGRGNTAWTGSDSAKEAALRKATSYLDSLYEGSWKGRRATELQSLLWPRAFVIDSDGYSLGSDTVPRKIVEACMALAVRALSQELATDIEGGGKKRERAKVGPIEIEDEYISSGPRQTKYTEVHLLVQGYLGSMGTGVEILERG